jgi:hypothetical protein
VEGEYIPEQVAGEGRIENFVFKDLVIQLAKEFTDG